MPDPNINTDEKIPDEKEDYDCDCAEESTKNLGTVSQLPLWPENIGKK